MSASVRMACCLLSLGLLPWLHAGCGASKSSNATVETSTAPPAECLKNWLTDLSTTGTLDSSSPMAAEWATQMQAAHEPHADEIKKDVDEILAMGNPEKIKAKAQKTLAKVEVSPR